MATGLLHDAFDGERCCHTEVGHVADVENQHPVLTHQGHAFADPLRGAKAERSVQGKQQHGVAALIEQLLLRLWQSTAVGAPHAGQLMVCERFDGEQIGHEHANQHRSNQIPEHSQKQHSPHHQGGFGGEAMGPAQEAPVDDVEPDLDQNSRQ